MPLVFFGSPLVLEKTKASHLGFGKDQGQQSSLRCAEGLEKPSMSAAGAGLEKPDGPLNKKGTLFGSGTTNQKRKESRAHKQWSNMDQADPSSPSHLLKHLEALEKARDQCQQKLKAKLQEAIDGVEQPGASGSSSSANHSSKKQKVYLGKMGTWAKAVLTPAEEVLEKTQEEEEEEEVFLKKTKSGWEEVVVPKTKDKVLEKTKVHKMPKAKDLEKSKGKDLEKSKGKPVVVVG